MAARPTIIKPDSREDKTTIQITKEIKEALIKIGLKNESYNKIIAKLISNSNSISNLERQNRTIKELIEADKPNQRQIKIGSNIIISKYERVIVSIKDKIGPTDAFYTFNPTVTLEITYNKPINKEDMLYQIDLKIDKIIFDNEAYSPKEFFGVLQKDMVYCEEFVYYYLRSIIEVIKIEFNKSNYFFRQYNDFFELARWRTFLLNSKLSPEILENDIESVLSDLKNEKTNNKLIEDVKNSRYKEIQKYGRDNP